MSKQDKAKQADRESNFNKLSSRTHDNIRQVSSRVRLSLTVRIAMHDCAQLMRTAILAMAILAIMLGIACGLHFRGTVKRIRVQEPDLPGGVYSQLILQEEGVEAAEVTDPAQVADLGAKIRTGLSRFPAHLVLPFRTPAGRDALLTVPLKEWWRALLLLFFGAVAADLLRMIYIFRRRNELNKTVLAPIHEITQLAETLSAANLSNRINLEGTKTELKDLAGVINSMLDRIEASYNSQKQFVSDVSHELRTPIAVLQGYADMLQRWGKDDPEVLQESLTAISQETQAMKELVESLLFLARHDKKTLILEMTDVDPCEVAQEVVREEQMVMPEDSFVLDPAVSCSIEADRGMVKQVLRILVDNAVKYSPKGSTVTIGCAKTAAGCTLSVHDQGSGIPAEELPKIFDRFYRADAARHSETGGHGLGLSIGRIIVLAHGGRIRVRSKVGEGTSFYVELPARQARAEDERPPEPDTRRGSGRVRKVRRNIQPEKDAS
ncbi:MAG: HAMP domain-containing protein [Clostridia bacterium]|nr:HAMP domain-containing protein [Clostridia bacterium]